MNFTSLDWLLVLGVVIFSVLIAYRSKKHTKSVADFLVANRTGGRYMLAMAEGMSGMGAISIIAAFQIAVKVGFGAGWWGQLAGPVAVIVTMAGFVTYRYRETRAMTLAQFFEMRYSRKFRITAGIIMWISGVLNFGIFPAVGANFFMTFCELPETFPLAGLNISTYQILLAGLILISYYMTVSGGQISVMSIDFWQMLFCNAILLLIIGFVLFKFSVSSVFESLLLAPEGKSMVDPFDAGKSEFSPWFFIIGIMGAVINRGSWQGSQAYMTSAISPHEQKMAGVVGMFRHAMFYGAITLFVPIVAFMIMNSPDHIHGAQAVDQILMQFENNEVRDQMLVPATMTTYLPMGLLGGFAAVMVLAFISTHDTYIHSWGSILLQDVILPFRKKPINNKRHLLYLRLSTAFVAAFVFIFSSFFRQTMDIYYWFAITGAIWLGGAGIIIIGGLYTRWGNTIGAYVALFVGSILGLAGVVLDQVWMSLYERNFPINGQYMYAIAMGSAAILYILISFMGKRTNYDLDKLLRRGKYAVDSDHKVKESAHSTSKWKFKELFGFTEEFTFGDKFIYGIYIGHSIIMFGCFAVMTIYSLIVDVSDTGWSKYHQVIFWYTLLFNVSGAIWLGAGGLRDYARMYAALKVAKRDFKDDGTVREHDFQENTQDTEL